MVLEATILCLDNSDWTRNGDYYPTRWDSQVDAINLIIENRCEKNPENSLGVVSMAGKRVEVHSSLTNDESRLLEAVKSIHLSGECDVITALNISFLTLKHRMNKTQKQRIILFIGSPIKNKPEELVKIGKKLKKNNVSVDIISFGHVEENKTPLTQFLNAVNNANSSSLIEIQVGCYIIETLLTSPVLGENFEQQMGQEQQGGVPNINQQGVGLSQYERDLNLAMEMSLQEANKDGAKQETKKGDEINEDDELEKAKLLSLQENEKVIQKQNEKKEKEIAKAALEDADFIKDILEEVSDEKVKDQDVKDILNKIKEDKKEDNKEDKKDDKKGDKKEDTKEEKK